MKSINYFLLLFVLFCNVDIYSKTINGVDIPDNLVYKLKEYRQKLFSDSRLGSRMHLDYSVNELNEILKKQVTYDDVYFCPVCDIYFPINSKSFFIPKNKTESFCIDGFPQHIRFCLPPECPFCNCFCSNGDYDYYNIKELYYNIFCTNYEFACRRDNPVEKYIYVLESLNNKITEYQKFSILYKFAICYKPENRNEIICDSLIELEKFFERSKNGQCISELKFTDYLSRIDIYRQSGKFEIALKYLSELQNLSEKKENSKDLYSILLKKEKALIDEKSLERALMPVSNIFIAAINENISVKDFKTIKITKVSDEQQEQLLEAIKLAIAEKKDDWVKYLCKLWPEVISAKDYYGNTILHVAAKLGSLETVKFLLAHGSVINALNMQNQSPIFLAIRYDRLENFNYLLDNGADLKIVDFENNTPLQVACIGHNHNSKLIIEKLFSLFQKKRILRPDDIQNCYSTIISHSSKDILEFFRNISNVEINLSKIKFNGFADVDIIPVIAELDGAEKFLYEDFFNALFHKINKHIEVYKSIKLYDKLFSRYQKDIEG